MRQGKVCLHTTNGCYSSENSQAGNARPTPATPQAPVSAQWLSTRIVALPLPIAAPTLRHTARWCPLKQTSPCHTRCNKQFIHVLNIIL